MVDILVWCGFYCAGIVMGNWYLHRKGGKIVSHATKEAYSRGWEDQKIVGDRNYVTGYNAGKMVTKARAGIES